MLLTGIFVIVPIGGEPGARIRAINERWDQKLSASRPPHITLAGSSGVGPLDPSTAPEEILRRLEPIASSTPPFPVTFGAPHRFLQSDIIVLPLNPHGRIRELHDRIASSGLRFQRARFTFTPHCTLNLYRSLTPEAARDMLSVRISEVVMIDRIQLYLSREPQPSRLVLELELKGESPAA